MMHVTCDSDSTSIAQSSSPRSPKRPPMYYVQSPSRDSHDGDKSSSSIQIQSSATYNNSPMESPSHLSIFGPHSRASSSSWVSGTIGSSWGRKVIWKRNGNEGLSDCNVLEERRHKDDDVHERGFTRGCKFLIALMGFLSIFMLFCLVIWGASRPCKTQVDVKSLLVHNFYFGEGSDSTGVPTKLLTVNCSVKVVVDNQATFFGIHVSSTPVNLFYSEIIVAMGQLKKYYQPRKSQRTVYVNLEGDKVPLYGAGASLAVSDKKGGVPMKLEFEIRSCGEVVGKLVKTKHRRHISCFVAINSGGTKDIQFNEDSCKYN